MSEIMLSILLLFCLVGFGFCIEMLKRNNDVYYEALRVLRLVSDAAMRDIRAGNIDGWQWRYELFAKVSYYEMLLKFWRPVESFYDVSTLTMIKEMEKR